MEEQQKPALLGMAQYWTTLADKIEGGEKIDDRFSRAPIAEQLKGAMRP
jgi:hypothetical protein